jgi:hypothetical protein
LDFGQNKQGGQKMSRPKTQKPEMPEPNTPEPETGAHSTTTSINTDGGLPFESSSEDERKTDNKFTLATSIDWRPNVVQEQDFNHMPIRFINVSRSIIRPALSMNRETFNMILQLARK